MYGVNLCNPSLELNQADKSKPYQDEPEYRNSWGDAAIAALDKFINAELKKEMLAKDGYLNMPSKYIPRVIKMKEFKDHTSALESRLRNAESFGARQVQAIVDHKLGVSK